MLLQSALEVALCVVRANPTVLEGLGAHLEGIVALYIYTHYYMGECLLAFQASPLALHNPSQCKQRPKIYKKCY